MTSTSTDDQRKARVTLVLLAAAVALLLIVVMVLAFAVLRGPRERTAAPSAPAPNAQPSAAADVTWESVAGVFLPVSPTHGPRATDDGRAAGFADSEFGAALAAVHVLVRTGANVGPAIYEPTITQQVTGTNAAAMKIFTNQQYQQLRVTTGAADGDPLPGGNAQVLGYRIAAFADETATVEVVMTASDLGGAVLVFNIALQRSAEDWLVIAPPRGDWGAVATTLSTAPEGMLSYGEDG